MHIILNNFINSSYYLVPKSNFKFNLKLNKKLLNLINIYNKNNIKNNFKIKINSNINNKKNYNIFNNSILIDKKLKLKFNFLKFFKKFILFFFIQNKFKFYNKFFKLKKTDQKKILKKYTLKFLKIFFNLINKNNSNKILKLYNIFKIIIFKYSNKDYKRFKDINKNKLFINYLTNQYNSIGSLLGYQTLLSSSLNENFFLLREFNLKKQFLYYFQIDLPNMSRKILKKKYILSKEEKFYLYTTPFKDFSIVPLTISENQNKFFKTYYKSTSLKNHLKGNLELINLINLNYNFIKSLFVFKKKINFNIFNTNLNFYNIYYFNNNINYLIKLKNFEFFNDNTFLNSTVEDFIFYPDIFLKFFFKKNKIIKIFNNFKKINYYKFYIKKYKNLNKILKFKLKIKFKFFKLKFKKILNLIFFKKNNYVKIKKKNKFFYKKKIYKNNKKLNFNSKTYNYIAYRVFMVYKKYKKQFKKKFKNITISKKIKKDFKVPFLNLKKLKLTRFVINFKKYLIRMRYNNVLNLYKNFKFLKKKFNFLNYFKKLNKINKIKNFFNYKKKKVITNLFNNLKINLNFKKKKKLLKNLNYIYLKFKLILKFNNIILYINLIKNDITKFKFLKKYLKYLYYFFKFFKKIKIHKIILQFFNFIKKKFFITIYLNLKQLILNIFLKLIINYFLILVKTKLKKKNKKKFNLKKKIIFLKKLIKNLKKSKILFYLLYKYKNFFNVINKINIINLPVLDLYNFNNFNFKPKQLMYLDYLQIKNFIINYKNNYILTKLNAST